MTHEAETEDQDMAKKKRKPKKITLPGQTVAQKPTGRDRPSPRIQEPAGETAIKARLRRMGLTDTPANRLTARSPLAESEAGLCVLAIYPDEGSEAVRRANRDMQARLYQTLIAVAAAIANFRARNLSLVSSAQGSSIPMLPEPMQTDQSHTIDTRTAEERDHVARRVEAYWRGLIGRLPAPQMRWALMPALDATEGALWRDGAPTGRGRNAVAALVWLTDAHEKPS